MSAQKLSKKEKEENKNKNPKKINSSKMINKEKKESDSKSLKDLDSIFVDDTNNELSHRNILKSYNMNIQLGLSSINNSNLLSETDSEIPIEKKPSKKIVQKKNTDKINDILMPEREIEESKSNQKN